MNDEHKAPEHLIDELAAMRQRVNELEAAVSKQEQAEELARGVRLHYAESIVETVREPLLVLDAELRVISANRSFYHTFSVSPEQTVNNLIYELGNRQWDIPQLRELLEEILPKNTHFNDFEVEHDFPTIGHRTMVLNARKISLEDFGTQLILLAIEDITDRKRAEEDLAKYRAHLEELVEERTDELAKSIETLEREIIERKRAEEELRFLKDFNENMAHSIQDGLVALDKGFRITFWNRAMGEISGHSADEVAGKSIYDVFPHLLEQGVEELLQSSMEGQVVERTNVPFETRKGKAGYTHERYLPLQDHEGQVLGMLAIVEDVTELIGLEQRVAHLQEEIKQRKVIEVAKGIIMRELSLSEDESYKFLQKKSQEGASKMVEVAKQVIGLHGSLEEKKKFT